MTTPPQENHPIQSQQMQPQQPMHHQQQYGGMPQYEPPKTRATGFLLVLCILTFIGSGFALLSSIPNLFSDPYDQIDDLNIVAEEFSKAGNDMPPIIQDYFIGAVDFAYAITDHYHLYNGIVLLTIIGSLIGAFLMLKLQRKGFLVYTISNVIQLLAPLIIIVNTMSVTVVIFGGIFTVLFIVLYSLNLKHMR